MSDFPSSRYERGKIMAGAGLKVGANYARYHIKKKLSLSHDEHALSKLHETNARHLFGQFSKLRGSALKLAQALSLDNSVLPNEYAEILTQAQYHVPPINKALVRTIIKKELGRYPEEIFAQFNTEAIAAASIGQVHRATLKSGCDVAVKIQYPNVRETITSDLEIAKAIFRRIRNSDNLDSYFKEVKSKLLEETDYLHEGKIIQEYHKLYNHDNYLTPEWIEELSTQKVLTMTFIEGRHLQEFIADKPGQKARDTFGQLLWDFFHSQINSNRTVHADLHPGNFIYTKEGKLGIIDFGCVKKCPKDFFNAFIELVPTHLENDINRIKALYIQLEMIKSDPVDPKFERQFQEFCQTFGSLVVKPYQEDIFDFGDPDFNETLKYLVKTASLQPEPRGSEHFVYIARVNLGLFHMLIKLKSRIRTGYAKKCIYDYLAIHATD